MSDRDSSSQQFFQAYYNTAVLLTHYCAGGKIGRMRWAGHVARMGEGKGVHSVLVGKPEGKSPSGRPRRRWEDNVNTLRTGDANLRFLRFCITTVKDE
jgi:hypothetical protein